MRNASIPGEQLKIRRLPRTTSDTFGSPPYISSLVGWSFELSLRFNAIIRILV